jgi:Fibronectin type III domain
MKVSGIVARASRSLLAAILFLTALMIMHPSFASAASLTVAQGQSAQVSGNLNPGETIGGAHVLFFERTSTGAYTGQKANAVANFIAGQSTMVSATFAPAATFAVGNYFISVGIYSSSWAPLRWVANFTNLTVATASAPVPTTPTQISGTPVTALNAGTAYSFAPSATAASGASLKFSIANQPVWAKFDTASGAMTGTPSAGDVGSYANIVISVSDGKTSASLSPFTVTVTQISNGVAAIQWIPPTENTDGSVLTNLVGYKIHYGTSAGALTQSVTITNAGLTAYTLSNLSPGTWYFAMTAYSAAGAESSSSEVISATL